VEKTATASETRINGVALDSLYGMIDRIRSEPALGQFQFRARTQWLDGGHTRSTVKDFYGAGREQHGRHRPFVFESDLPAVFNGGNTAVNPLENLLSAVGACLTTTIVYQSSARGIYIDAIDCQVEGDIDLRGFLGLDASVPLGYEEIRLRVSIEADVADDDLDSLIALGQRYSPIIGMLRPATRVTVKRDT
jgi:uncharacterized OsmC-like protein